MTNLLDVSADSELTNVSSEGIEEFTLNITVTNSSDEFTKIESAYFIYSAIEREPDHGMQKD